MLEVLLSDRDQAGQCFLDATAKQHQHWQDWGYLERGGGCWDFARWFGCSVVSDGGVKMTEI